MEYTSPTYELLFKCETIGIKKPFGYDLLPENYLLEQIIESISNRSINQPKAGE